MNCGDNNAFVVSNSSKLRACPFLFLNRLASTFRIRSEYNQNCTFLRVTRNSEKGHKAVSFLSLKHISQAHLLELIISWCPPMDSNSKIYKKRIFATLN